MEAGTWSRNRGKAKPNSVIPSSLHPSPPRRPGWLLKLALRAEAVYDAVHRFLARVTGRLGKPMAAEIYHAIRHASGVSVKGRILLARTWPHPDPHDPGIVNLYHMLRRWCTPERPYSLVRIGAGGAPAEQRADREGYFEIDLPAEEAPDDEVLVELPESAVSSPARWPVEPLAEDPDFIVLSDIDDTVLVTHAGRIFAMLATTLFGNALTRQLFPGVVELYRALRRGSDPRRNRRNPIAYVTSSPYNLHGLIELIFTENGLPLGPFFMTDWGLDEDKWLIRSHRDHKLAAIRKVLSWHPGKPALLFGDTTQHDVAIYVEAALEHPERIAAILIHAVSSAKRVEQLRAEAAKLDGTGTDVLFFVDYSDAAEHLAAGGWISAAETGRTAIGESERRS